MSVCVCVQVRDGNLLGYNHRGRGGACLRAGTLLSIVYYTFSTHRTSLHSLHSLHPTVCNSHTYLTQGFYDAAGSFLGLSEPVQAEV